MPMTDSERKVLREAAEIIKRETEAGEKVTIREFGTFARVDRKAKSGRNPKTGAAISIPAKNVLTFHASKATVE